MKTKADVKSNAITHSQLQEPDGTERKESTIRATTQSISTSGRTAQIKRVTSPAELPINKIQNRMQLESGGDKTEQGAAVRKPPENHDHKMTSTTGNTSNLKSAVSARPKLTLPEEIKETEYMTALQRQKARVSRIRRCIVAATVIQRAWREHKLKQ